MPALIIALLISLTTINNPPKYVWLAHCPYKKSVAVSFPYNKLEHATDSLHYFLDDVCLITACDTMKVYLYKNDKVIKEFSYVCLD